MSEPFNPTDDSGAVDLAPGDGDPVTAFMLDIETAGAVVEVDPDDAERAGAFVEDALTPADAADAVFDAREAA
jgi:hypothetical protein